MMNIKITGYEVVWRAAGSGKWRVKRFMATDRGELAEAQALAHFEKIKRPGHVNKLVRAEITRRIEK